MSVHEDEARPSFAIGGGTWPGLAKLLEECGELQQVIGKIVAYPETVQHPDGVPRSLEARLEDEMADVWAALEYVHRANRERFDDARLEARYDVKLERFRRWEREASV